MGENVAQLEFGEVSWIACENCKGKGRKTMKSEGLACFSQGPQG